MVSVDSSHSCSFILLLVPAWLRVAVAVAVAVAQIAPLCDHTLEVGHES